MRRASMVIEEAGALRNAARTQKQQFASVLRFTHAGTARSGPALSELEVQNAREALRTTYLTLLFAWPWTAEAQNSEVLLWNDTTYTVILYFREQLAQLEKEVARAPSKKSAATKSERASAKVHEYERTLRDFRRFLKDEVAFWEQLAVRIVRIFGLDDVRKVLKTLRLHDDDAQRDAQAPGSSAHTKERVREARQAGHRLQLRETLQRVLTYCGDLVRYQEMHVMPPAPLAQRRAQHTSPRPAEFRRAVQLYHEAHLLLPDHGSPANQLAVVATVLGDTFGAMYQYYCAQCVAHPFENARFNLNRLMDKAVQRWNASPMRVDAMKAWRQAAMLEPAAGTIAVPIIQGPGSSAETWLDAVVLLHALLAQQVELDGAAVLSAALLRQLVPLVETHAFRAVDYVRLIVIGVCALDTATTSPAARTATSPCFSTGLPARGEMDEAEMQLRVQRGAEMQMVVHLLGTMISLLAVGRHELRQSDAPSPMPGAVLRRIMPALRLGGRWVQTHCVYLEECLAYANAAHTHMPSQVSHDGFDRLACIYASFPALVASFWGGYTDLANLLNKRFPRQDTGYLLPEDAELGALRGWHGAMKPTRSGTPRQVDLARVADLLADLRTTTKDPASPVQWDTAKELFVYAQEDDPVAMAMRTMDAGRATQGDVPPFVATPSFFPPEPARALRANAHDLLRSVQSEEGWPSLAPAPGWQVPGWKEGDPHVLPPAPAAWSWPATAPQPAPLFFGTSFNDWTPPNAGAPSIWSESSPSWQQPGA